MHKLKIDLPPDPGPVSMRHARSTCTVRLSNVGQYPVTRTCMAACLALECCQLRAVAPRGWRPSPLLEAVVRIAPARRRLAGQPGCYHGPLRPGAPMCMGVGERV